MSNLKGLLIITLFFFINGCNKKELSPLASEGSFLELNGEKYKIPFGYYRFLGQIPNSYDANSVTELIFIENRNKEVFSSSNNLQFSMSLYSKGNSLEEGMYQIGSNELNLAFATLYFVDKKLEIEFDQGSVKIEGRLPKLTITVEATTKNNENLKMKYSGILDVPII